jgi:hypothetical protein
MKIDTQRKSPAVLALLVMTIGPSWAEPRDDATPGESSPEDIASRILEEKRDVERRVVGLGRFRLSFPQRASGAVGVMIVRQPANYDCSAVCEFKGPFFQAEPGLSGGQLAAGYATLMGEKGRNEHFLSRVYTGYGVKGVLMRTWHDASLRPPDQTLLGVEGDFTIVHINFSLAVLRHVGSGDPRDPWVVGGGVGWGF